MPRITEFQILQKNEQPALTIRLHTKVQDLPMHIGASYGKIAAYMAELDIHPADVPFVAYYNMDMQDLDVEIGFPVASILSGNGDIKQSAIPKGRFVFCMYLGPYGDMKQTYDEMGAWLMDNGLVPVGTAYEQYYNGPDMPEDQLLTKIAFPIQ